MATSQNGWTVLPVHPNGDLEWVTGYVRDGDVLRVFDYLCTRFNREVERIKVNESWGWAYRAIRGQSSGFSNHASGTAIDLNAPQHPLGAVGTFSDKQEYAIHRILASLEGAVRWGGDYSGRKDEMHFEINVSPDRLARIASRLGEDDMEKNDEITKWDPVDGAQGVTTLGMTWNQARGYAEEAYRAAHRADVRTKRIEAALAALAKGLEPTVRTAVEEALEDFSTEVQVTVAEEQE